MKEKDKLILDVFYMTGIRAIELINLNLSDIDFQKSILKVIGKKNKERIIPLPPILLDKLKIIRK